MVRLGQVRVFNVHIQRFNFYSEIWNINSFIYICLLFFGGGFTLLFLTIISIVTIFIVKLIGTENDWTCTENRKTALKYKEIN